jgi:general transcription factor IIIA
LSISQCEITGCKETFAKRKHVRAHVIARHSDLGQRLTDLDQEEAEKIARLPFSCTHQGCQKRFATNSKRNAHARGHEDKTKYMCALQHVSGDSSILYFSTWTELRQHQRDAHPPTCTWPGCGKTFANLQNLRHHTQKHQEKEGERSVPQDEADDSDVSIEGGEEKKTFACDWEEGLTAKCTKTFQSKYARDIHVKNRHLGLQEFVCRHEGCSKRYGNKRSLNRHLAKCHKASSNDGGHSGDDESDQGTNEVLDDDFFREEGGAVPESFAERQPARKRAREVESSDLHGLLSSLTGSGYGDAGISKKRKMRGRVVTCPWEKVCLLRDGEQISACAFRFSRLYDVQRHLESTHGIVLTQGDILSLIGDEEGSRLATPRSGNREDSGEHKEDLE